MAGEKRKHMCEMALTTKVKVQEKTKMKETRR